MHSVVYWYTDNSVIIWARLNVSGVVEAEIEASQLVQALVQLTVMLASDLTEKYVYDHTTVIKAKYGSYSGWQQMYNFCHDFFHHLSIYT